MKDVEVDSDHTFKKIVIYEADVDIGIIPMVQWLNSLKGIITRFSCEGGDPIKNQVYQPPYIIIWVEQYDDSEDNDFGIVERLFRQYDVEIWPQCTEGMIDVYHITFNSRTEMQQIQSNISDWTPKTILRVV
ncbi:hypothetical protein LCGC14_2478440 [marine sediment metagenome]|uniref:Uncharacterized protein n=1 Tax=marine sediment metagenome TaxID=412755 RepID=A0A0F9BW44_9ZZZZ